MLAETARGKKLGKILGNMVARFADFQGMNPNGEDVAVVVDGGRPLLLPRSAARLDPEARGLLGRMQMLALQVVELERQLHELTRQGRDLGVSWSVLGFVQGLTGEALRLRYAEDDSEGV
jgi:hypothetical protein